jgi:alpha-L-arabinofuranosidase
MKPNRDLLAIALLSALALSAGVAAPLTLTVQTSQPGPAINPAMWGIFFEDINFGADGGLYAELVKNRSFEFPDPLMGWARVETNASLSIRVESPFSTANPHYLRLASGSVVNEGFRGIGVRQGDAYAFSVQARAAEGNPVLRVELVSSNGQTLASERLKGIPNSWRELTATLKPSATTASARLLLHLEGDGSIDLDMVSLFPRHTWKNRPGGLRADMVQWLADLKPGFMRFPGGCIVEGRDLANRYQWKNTIGPVAERKLLLNRWNVEFKHRPAPDYYQSFGLGFFEYFQLCEDIGAEPLPILSCGLACQYNTGQACPMDQLQPFIQDALDLIEFANGPANSPWGARRAAMGHPKPFHLKLLGVGNENWDAPYLERYTAFHKALKAAHPEVQLISSAGPYPEDKHFHYAWPRLRELGADLVDEHCYAKPEWFLKNTHRYDAYDRNGPKVFMGEYAAHSPTKADGRRRNDLASALGEAAYMIGLERNADVVRMASYAPLFAHIDAWQWSPDLIWVDNLRSYGTPNYYAQQLFSRNRGDQVVPISLNLPATTNTPDLFASAARDQAAGELILKLVNTAPEPRDLSIRFEGSAKVARKAREYVLTAGSPSAENSFEQPRAVAPVETSIPAGSSNFPVVLSPNSLTVLRVKASH